MVAPLSSARLDLFRRAGIFVRTDLIDRATCLALCTEMAAAPSEMAGIHGGSAAIDPSIRRTRDVALTSSLAERMTLAIVGLTPDIAAHFGHPLGDCDAPSFLIYKPGGFYRPHRDRAPAGAAAAGSARARSVSVVVLLNDDYQGGALTLYDLFGDPRLRDYGAAVPAEPGLLVAFRSDMLHEVTPVTTGERFSVVTWFNDPARLSE